MRDWDVWQKHKDYHSIIGLATEIPKDTIEKLERIGFVVDDGSKPAVEAGQLFILHVRDLDKRNYWKKYEEYKNKYRRCRAQAGTHRRAAGADHTFPRNGHARRMYPHHEFYAGYSHKKISGSIPISIFLIF